ncbi:MAG TPA: hypothetical protein DCO86_04050, partial [Spirochaetaceae bacterium]|nr:hypothetical protein [Spirochaetaceae bacterium]
MSVGIVLLFFSILIGCVHDNVSQDDFDHVLVAQKLSEILLGDGGFTSERGHAYHIGGKSPVQVDAALDISNAKIVRVSDQKRDGNGSYMRLAGKDDSNGDDFLPESPNRDDDDDDDVDYTEIGRWITSDAAPNYFKVKWDLNKMIKLGIPIDKIEVFVFKLRIYIEQENGQKSYFIWRSEVSPLNGKFYLENKLNETDSYDFHMYVKFIDNTIPKASNPSQRKFIDADKVMCDPNDDYDRLLWYIGALNDNTIHIPGSGIIGNYGYDVRKGGLEFNPDALVGSAWLDLYPITKAHPDAIEAKDYSEQDQIYDMVSRDYMESYSWEMAESDSFDITPITGFIFGGATGAASASAKNSKKQALDKNGTPMFKRNDYYTLQSYDFDGQRTLANYQGKQQYEPVTTSTFSNPQLEMIKALAQAVNSLCNSCFALCSENSDTTSSSAVKIVGNSVVAKVTRYTYLTNELLTSNFRSYDKLKGFLIKDFYNDVNNIGVRMTPEMLFDKYGTHVLFRVNMGGKMVLNYKGQSYHQSSNNSLLDNFKEQVTTGGGGHTNSNNADIVANALDVKSWGGNATATTVTTLQAFNSIKSKWESTLSKKNMVFVNSKEFTKDACGIWNFADNPKRQQEIYEAFRRYVFDYSVDTVAMVNSTPKYLMDLVVFKVDKDDKDSSYYHLSGLVDEFLMKKDDSGKPVFKSDLFSGSYAYDKNGDISDDITFTRVFTTDSSNKVLSFGNNVYGFALYTPEPSLSLSGIAVTKSDDSSFQKHADDLKEK